VSYWQALVLAHIIFSILVCCNLRALYLGFLAGPKAVNLIMLNK